MHSVRLNIRFGYLTGTALALILTVSTAASAAPQNTNEMRPPQPAARDYSTPGSMPKPSTTIDDGIRFRGTLPASSGATPLAPASTQLRREPEAKPAKPVATAAPAAAPEQARAETVPETNVTAPEPVAKFAPSPAPVSRPVAAPAAAPEPAARPVAAPAPVARPVAAPVRSAAVDAPAANAATEAEVGNKIKEIITGKQFDRMVTRKPDRDAIIAFYQKARSFQPLWVAQGAASERARDVV